ncbi:MAG TPA: ABC transporter permease [bacterium]|nr:ABC transporter permease [bacterium]
MQRLVRIKAIIKKEFRQISRDIGTLGTLVILPLALLVLFGYAISLDVKEIRVAVWDLDGTDLSREYQRGFFNSSYFTFQSVIRSSQDRDEALAEGMALAVLTIPPGFARAIDRGETATVQFLVDASNSTTASTAIGYLNGADLAFSLAHARGHAVAPKIDLRPRVVFNQELKSVNSLIPGLIVLILTLAAVVSTALTLVREKEHGTREQLSVSPITPLELVIGKTLPYLMVALVSTTLILSASWLFFGVTVKGSLVLLYLTTILFLFASLGIGILISSIVSTQQAAFMISAILTVLPTFILTGFVFPIRNMPPIIQVISAVLPARYYLAILRTIILKGAGISSIYREILVLSGFAVLMLGLGTFRVSRTRS